MDKGVRKGFTLLEVMLSMALLAVLAGIGLPVYQSLQNRNDLDIAAATIAQSSRRAQVLSVASYGDTTWGLRVQAGGIIIFKGSNYASRDTTYDEIYELSGSIIPSGLAEIVYAKLTGAPSATGTVTLTGKNNETRTITFNSKGTADY